MLVRLARINFMADRAHILKRANFATEPVASNAAIDAKCTTRITPFAAVARKIGSEGANNFHAEYRSAIPSAFKAR